MVWEPRGTRGQTPQDFAIGASIMLVTIIGTFAFVQGGVFTAFQEPVSGDVETAAERVGSYVVDEYSVEGERNVLRYNESDGIRTDLDAEADLADLKLSAGLAVGSDRRRTHSVNVSLVNSSALSEGDRVPAERSPTVPHPGGRDKLAWGQDYDGQDGMASTVRIVSLNDPGNKCRTVCWLHVRVW